MNLKLMFEILIFSLFPFACINIGGLLGTFFTIKGNARSFLLHLAAGVIFAVVSIEMLPSVVKGQNLYIVTFGFFIGLALMMGIKYLTRGSEKKHKQVLLNKESSEKSMALMPWGLLVGIAVDIFIDGILLGIGFAAGQTEGLLLCVALSLELLALGLVVSTELKSEKFVRKTILTSILILSSSICLGALIGSFILNYISAGALTGILSFGLSALMYLVTEELLVEAHEVKDTPLNTAVFFIGFFVFMMIAILN
jgi:zinc transporter, ZIP family